MDLTQKVGKYFSLAEMVESPYARRHNITEQFNPPADVVANLKKLCANILDPLREKAGPIVITSGYRCPRVNSGVGGQPTSQHMTGEAADIHAVSISKSELFDYIRSSNLPFDQLIWEYGDNNNPSWVHVSFGPRNRRQVVVIGDADKKKVMQRQSVLAP